MANTTADKLALLASNKADIKAAIAAKNPATAPTDVMSQWPTAIASIPSGARNWRGYQPPSDWPDIPSILEANKESGYQYAMAFLIDSSQVSVRLHNDYATKFKCSDGFETTSLDTTHTWTDTGYHWCVALSNNILFNVGHNNGDELTGTGIKAKTLLVYGDGVSRIYSASGYNFVTNSSVGSIKIRAILCDFVFLDSRSSSFGNCKSLEYVKGNVYLNNPTDLFSISRLVSGSCSIRNIDLNFIEDEFSSFQLSRAEAFRTCYVLENVKSIKFPKHINTLFAFCTDCYSLKSMTHDIDMSECTSCYWMFKNCYSLTRVFDNMDMKICTDVTGMFEECYSLIALPKNVTVNISLSFSYCSGVAEKDSVATFDGDGNVVGGFVGNLRSWDGTQYVSSCPNSGQTITFNNNIKALFTPDEWTAVKAALTAKNWGCSPA